MTPTILGVNSDFQALARLNRDADTKRPSRLI